MKRRHAGFLPVLIASSGLLQWGCASLNPAPEVHRVHHVVVVWLKKPGDQAICRQYVEASKPLAQLPGVLSYEIGTPVQISRGRANAALDESYDIAISGRYESQQALEDFLKNPEYVRVAQQLLKPLVDRYKVYDFIE